jgi:hypothetical protein
VGVPMNFNWWILWAGALFGGYHYGASGKLAGFWVNIFCATLIIALEIWIEYFGDKKKLR